MKKLLSFLICIVFFIPIINFLDLNKPVNAAVSEVYISSASCGGLTVGGGANLSVTVQNGTASDITNVWVKLSSYNFV